MNATGPTSRARLVALALGALTLASAWLPGLAGQVVLYPALGAFPGLALAWALLPDEPAATRWVVGLGLAPLVSSIVGWALLFSHVSPATAAITIAAASWLAWFAQLGRGAKPVSDSDPSAEPIPGAMWILSLGLAAAVIFPHVVNQPWMFIKSDAWIHGGIVYQLLERGMPPEDPRFAGLHLNYVWFFNLFIGLLTAVRDGSPFVFMTLMNVVDVALIGWVVWLLAGALWRSRDAAVGAALLACFGFNAFAWLLWPVRGIGGFIGRERGWDLVREAYRPPPYPSWQIMQHLGAPYTYVENFIDKFVTGTSINYTWILMLLLLWGLVHASRARHVGALWVVALASGGMQLWHGVVGLSVVPVAACALAVVWIARFRWPWLPPATRLADGFIAMLVGFLATVPYLRSISRGWDPRESGLHVSPVHLDPFITITTVTSCAFAFALAWRPARRAWLERRPEVTWLAVYAAGMLAFSLLIALPNRNEAKFPIEAFFALAVLGGAAFMALGRRLRLRSGRWGAAAFAALLALPHVVTLGGFAFDPEHLTDPALHPAPGESVMYDWIRAHTPHGAVLVDAGYRDLAMVRARRQLYLGSSSGPERAAFPIAQVVERRGVMADLYGEGRSLDDDASALRRLGRPAYVICRPADPEANPLASAAIARRNDLFQAVYDRDGFVLYAVSMTPADREARP